MMRLWVIPVLLTLSGTLFAQSQYVPPCASAALDATVQGVERPDHTYTLAINLRNISVETCSLDTDAQGTSVSNGPGGQLAVKICHNCEQSYQRPLVMQIKLAPGESVHQTRNWSTAPAYPVKKCVAPTQMTWSMRNLFHGYFQLESPALLKPICSQLVTTDYSEGRFLPEENTWPPAGWRAPVIHWANGEEVSYSREHMPLRVSVDDPDRVLSRDEHSCPRLFIRVRDANASRDAYRVTRIDEVKAACHEEPSGALTIDFDAGFAFNHSDEVGEYTLDVSSLAESEGHYHLVNTTDRLQLSFVDGKPMRRNWNQPTEGLAVSLTADSDLYDVGGVVPLHIAVENFDSRKEIAVTEIIPLWGQGNTDVSLELQTPGGPQVIRLAALDQHCRHYLMPGLVYPVELPLSGPSFSPGIYQAVAVWKPSRNGSCGEPHPADYFTVRSRPVVFRIIEPRHPGNLPEQGNTENKQGEQRLLPMN
jgi:hypothetical protein